MLNVAIKPFILNVIMLNVIMLNVIMLNIIMLNVIMLNVIMLNAIMVGVMAPVNGSKRERKKYINVCARRGQTLNKEKQLDPDLLRSG
jgi:hypothetical protein